MADLIKKEKAGASKKKKKLVIVILCIFAILTLCVCALFIFSGDKSENNLKLDDYYYVNQDYDNSAVDENKVYSQTIMIYVCASDLESENGCATNDLTEIANSGIDTKNNNVLVYTGGSTQWQNDYVSADENAIYRLEDDKFVKLESYERSSVVSSDSLKRFLDYGFSNFVTDFYSLILWNHGGGPINGYGQDEYNLEYTMLVPNMIDAIRDSENENNKKLEWMGFDACLMSSIEVVSTFAPYTNYFIGSEEAEPGSGWNYSFMARFNESGMNGANIGIKICENYGQRDKKGDLTLTCFDTSIFSDFSQKFNALFENDIKINDNNFSQIVKARQSTKDFGGFSTAISYDLVDVENMLSNISSDAQQIKDCLKVYNDAIVARYSNVPLASGLSVYYPNDDLEFARVAVEEGVYSSFFSNLSSYYDFIYDYYQTKSQGKNDSSNKNIKESDVVVKSSSEKSDFKVLLTKEQMENFAGARYYIIEKNTSSMQDEKEDTYLLAFCSDDVKRDGLYLTASYEDKALYLVDKGKLSPAPLIAIETDLNYDSATRYLSYGVLTNYDYFSIDSTVPKEKGIRSCKIQISLENGSEKAKVVQAVPIDSNDKTRLASKQLLDLKDFDLFETMCSGYIITRDKDNNLLPFYDWKRTDFGVGIEAEIENGELTVEKHKIKDKENFYCQFVIYDIYGNITASELIPFE